MVQIPASISKRWRLQGVLILVGVDPPRPANPEGERRPRLLLDLLPYLTTDSILLLLLLLPLLHQYHHHCHQVENDEDDGGDDAWAAEVANDGGGLRGEVVGVS